MLHAQINHKSYSNANILLRQSYDLFLLTEKENPCTVFNEFGPFRNEANAWLATSALLLGTPNLSFKKTKTVTIYMGWYVFLQKHYRIAALYRHLRYFAWRFGRYISLPIQAVFNPVIRTGIIIRLTDKSWYGKHIESYRMHFNPHLQAKIEDTEP